MPIESKDNPILLLLLFLGPSVFILQPIFPDSIEPVIIYLRMIILPIGFVLAVRRSLHLPSLCAVSGFALLTSVQGFQSDFDYAILIFVSLIGSVLMFRLGAIAMDRFTGRSFWAAIIHGVTLVNAITVFCYVGVVVGFLDLSFIFDMVARDTQLGYWRFALGNAIETPFVITSVLAAAIRLAPAHRTYLSAAMLNFVTAGISESRVIVLIAALLLITQIVKSRPVPKSAALFVLGVAGYFLIDQVLPILESLGERFSFTGRDYGSKDDRLLLMFTVLGSLSPSSLLFGTGLTGGAQLMAVKEGDYRTVESAFLQIGLELGLIGLFLVFVAMVVGLRVRFGFRNLFSPLSLLLLAEIFLLVPIHNQMALTFAALGVAVASPRAKPLSKRVRSALGDGPVTDFDDASRLTRT